MLEDYYIGELDPKDHKEYKNQYVYTDSNKEGGPVPIIWVIGKKIFLKISDDVIYRDDIWNFFSTDSVKVKIRLVAGCLAAGVYWFMRTSA